MRHANDTRVQIKNSARYCGGMEGTIEDHLVDCDVVKYIIILDQGSTVFATADMFNVITEQKFSIGDIVADKVTDKIFTVIDSDKSMIKGWTYQLKDYDNKKTWKHENNIKLLWKQS